MHPDSVLLHNPCLQLLIPALCQFAGWRSITLDSVNNELKKIEIGNIKRTEDFSSSSFSTDTGLIIILERSIFLEFLKRFNYDQLVEGLNCPINVSYWIEMERKFNAYSCGLILSPGVKSGFDFDNSGQYKIEIGSVSD